MMYRTAALLAFVAGASAKSFIPEADIKAESALGKKLMSKARQLEQNNQDQERDPSWMVNYSIKYLSCASLPTLREEGGGDEGILYNQNLVKFALCPSDSCDSCTNGQAQYVVNMMDFVDIYTEMKLTEQEMACENMREYGCNCENANDDEACENACYANAGMEYCIEYEGQEEFEIQRYLECAELEAGENNNNNGNGNYYQQNNNNGNVNMNWQYYVGMACSESDGKSINLAVYTDAGCSQKAGSGIYEALNYGNSLPFENEPIVSLNDCISCQQVDENQNNNNNNGNNNGDVQLAEICEQTYETAARCESGVELSSNNYYYFYPDTSGCNYINNVLPRLDKATRKSSSSSGGSSGSSGGAAVAAAVIFAITTAVLGAYSFFLYRKIHRAKVNLAHAEGSTMA